MPGSSGASSSCFSKIIDSRVRRENLKSLVIVSARVGQASMQ